MAKLKRELGPLEMAVMDFVWDADPREVSVRDVLESSAGRQHAYTTVMTILDRLWRKRFLSRRRVGRAYLYRPRIGREQHVQALIEDVLAASSDRRSAMLGFVRGVGEADLEGLRAAIRQVERERRRER
jgi:predicted transcriptional regulator